MPPTREQVIEWALESGFSVQVLNSIDGDEALTECCGMCVTDELSRLAALAYSAGRLKGLDEAKVAALAARDLDEEKRARDRAMAARGGDMENEVRKLDHYFTVVAYNAGLNKCAAAIDQLKEQK